MIWKRRRGELEKEEFREVEGKVSDGVRGESIRIVYCFREVSKDRF